MSVKVMDEKTGKETTGKYASVKGDQVSLYNGIMSDKKGGWRGCGKRIVFPAENVTVIADDPAKELKQQGQGKVMASEIYLLETRQLAEC